MLYKLEVIAFNIESCTLAAMAGAHRIELCDNPGGGGTTPSYGLTRAARKAVAIELYPIIRPRGGDFLYSDEAFRIMKADIELCRSLGCDGVVTGILNADGTVDKKRCQVLVDAAYPMGVTFHRAFDRTNDPGQALEDIIDIGFERILTSGLQPRAMDGAPLIKALIQQSGERIIIMPGSDVRSTNIRELAEATGATEFHSSARKNTGSKMSYTNALMKEQLQSVELDAEEVSRLLKELDHT